MDAKPGRVKLAIIGCGRIAIHHCVLIGENPDLELVAVCDLDESRSSDIGAKYKVPNYKNYREMLENHQSVDTVVIATPSGMHFEHSMEILERFRKNIVVEKPTFMKPSQVTQSFSLARKLGLNVYPVFQNRYNSAVQRVKNAVVSGELGKIRLASVRVRWCRPQRYYDLSPWRGTFAMDGGALTNQGIHHIDLLRYISGEIDSVTATMKTFGAEIEVEDTVVSTIQFKSGAVGTLEITTAARPIDFEASISLACENGLAQIGGIAVNELQIFTPNPHDCLEFSQDFSNNVYGRGHVKLYESIVESRVSGKPYIIDEIDCFNTINLLHAFYNSSDQNASISLSENTEFFRLGEHRENLSNIYRTI